MHELLSELLQVHLLEQLFERAGPVLQLLLLVALLLWGLLLSRLWYRFVCFPGDLTRCKEAENKQIFLVAAQQLQSSLAQSMGLIKTTISVCPLLGLMGTVIGMIEIFDLIAYAGVGDAKLMASGVARAILPTMAGMVLAISAMLLFGYLQRWSISQKRQLSSLSLGWTEHRHEV